MGDALAPTDLPDFSSYPAAYHWETVNENGYKITEELYGTEKPIRVVAIGAGASGINLAKFLPEQVNNLTLKIYDKNAEVGGTWFENTYPGVACDIPSANYQFHWARNPRWKHFYSLGDEIEQYFKDVVEQHKLRQYFHLRQEVTHAEWNQEEGVWKVQVKNLATGETFIEEGEVFINNGGLLNNWKWPDVEGLFDFKGQLCHTANYDHSISSKGKKVAVIGVGSSGIQIVPRLALEVEHLYTFIRSPTWVTAGFAQQYAGPNGANFEYSAEQTKRWTENPLEYQEYCKNIENELNQRFKFILNGTPDAEKAKEFSISQMKQKLGNRTDIADRLIPSTFNVGCRRPTPGNGFLEALTLPNVSTFTEPCLKVTERGFVDGSGKEHEVDIIICATGFDTTWVPRFPIIANGRNIQTMHKARPVSYLSIAMPDIPNYFTICGPYGPLGHGSYIAVSGLLVGNIIEILKKMQKEKIKSLTPRREVCEKFTEHADLFLKRTAWSGDCSSWFKGGSRDGKLTMFPGSRLVYFDLLRSPRFEDYHIEYQSENGFNFLGNGFHVMEFDGSDISYYCGTVENPGANLPGGSTTIQD